MIDIKVLTWETFLSIIALCYCVFFFIVAVIMLGGKKKNPSEKEKE